MLSWWITDKGDFKERTVETKGIESQWMHGTVWNKIKNDSLCAFNRAASHVIVVLFMKVGKKIKNEWSDIR